MRIVQSIASTRVDHGGTSRSVPALCDALTRLRDDIHLIVGLPTDDTVESNLPAPGTTVHALREKAGARWRSGQLFADQLRKLSQDATCMVHDHGIWLSTNHAVAKVCRQQKLPRVVSPRGMAGSWAMAHGRWKKRLAWLAYQRRDLLSATAFHATSQQEVEEIRGLGCRQPIALIPNGLSRPMRLPERQPHFRKRCLFMSRIHPKKGLLNLIEAWHRACIPGDWELRLVGPDENGHMREIEQAIERFHLGDAIRLVGPVADCEKWQEYVNADLFVLPSFNENFGIVIAEAMSAGLPVVTTTGTPWQVLVELGSGWWVAPTVDALCGALRDAAGRSSEQLQAMGGRGANYVIENYSWNEVGSRMLEFYNWLSGPVANPPSFVTV